MAAAGVALFWPGLWSWFQLDDFAWLGVARRSQGIWDSLGAATQHGTWRPISEPLFFTLFYRWFGLDAVPYRLVAFTTYFADVILIGVLAARLGAAAGESLLAAVLFAFSPVLIMPMTWTCSYNQLPTVGLLCLELMLWQKFCAEGGRLRYAGLLALQVLSVLLLETNVMFPAVAALYVIGFAERRLLWRVAPLAAIAAGWALLHLHHAPPAGGGPYHLQLSGLAEALWRYWRWTVLPPQRWEDQAWRSLLPALFAVGVIASLRSRRRQFFLAVYLLLLAPSLLLPDHVTDYLLVAPMVGFAPLAASLFAQLWTARLWQRIAVTLLVGVYLATAGWAARFGCNWWSRHQASIERPVRGLAALRRRDPVTPIRLSGANDDFLNFAAVDNVFESLGLGPTCVELAAPPRLPPGRTLPPGMVCGPPEPASLRISMWQLARESRLSR